jgi:hypothetical protein
MICFSIHQRLRALLAQLQACLHGHLVWIASHQATPLYELHSVGTLAKRNHYHALLHLNVKVVVK